MTNDFSLVLGGPLYQLFLRTRLARPELELVVRRILAAVLVTWAPLLFLCLGRQTAFSSVPVPFLFDVATHVRFLIALPLLLIAECMVHQMLHPMIQQTLDRDIITAENKTSFLQWVDRILGWRNSWKAEVALLLIVYAVTYQVSSHTALKVTTWYSDFMGPEPRPTPAGVWYTWISMPLFQFILLRWYFRWGLWTVFLLKLSRMPLRLTPTHPDHACGLSYLSHSAIAFAPIVMAMSSIVSGVVAGKILYQGATLASFKLELLALIVFLALFSLGPLCLFIPRLARAKREGELNYGVLASRYITSFDTKWVLKGNPSTEALLGSSDIQSLADMANSYAVVNQVRLVPFERNALIQTAAAALIPLLPLILFVIPFDELLMKVLKIIF
jgi:hypothetical protein